MPSVAELKKQYTELAPLSDEQVVDTMRSQFYPDMPREKVAAALGVVPEQSSTLRRWVADPALSLMQGAVSLPETAVGLADLATGGHVGKTLENRGGAIGYRPAEARAMLADWMSPEQKAANAAVQGAQGIQDTTAEALAHPSVIAHSVLQALPLMLGGGVVGRAVATMAPMATPVVAGAIGQGLIGAGQTAETTREATPTGLLTPQQSGIAALSGVAQGALTLLGSRAAEMMGISSIPTMLAGKAAPQVTKGYVSAVLKAAVSQDAASQGTALLKGAVSQGALQAFPQAIAQQVANNAATGRPLDEGVSTAAVLAALSGAMMGSGGEWLASGHQKMSEADQLRQEKVPDRGPASRAVNAGIEADATAVQAVEAAKPVRALDRVHGIVPRESLNPEGMQNGQVQAIESPTGPTGGVQGPIPGDGTAQPAGGPGPGAGPTGGTQQGPLKPGDLAAAAIEHATGVPAVSSQVEPATGKAAAPSAVDTSHQGGPADAVGQPGNAGDATAGVQAAQPVPAQGQEVLTPTTLGQEAQGPTPQTLGQNGPDWVAFPTETGTLGVPRADMPQIDPLHHGALTQFLKARGITHQMVDVPVETLKPTQAEFAPGKVEAASQPRPQGDRAILISSDGYILDGHHQALAKLAAGTPVRALQLDAPMDRLMAEAKSFPSAGAANGATPASTPDASMTPGSDVQIPASKGKAPSVADIHAAADAKGVAWDNNPQFMALTKQLTGQEHLDALTPEQRQVVIDHLGTLGATSSAAAPAKGEMDRQGLRAEDRRMRDLDSAASDLASQMHGDFTEGSFDASEVAPGLEKFAKDWNIPTDDLRGAVLKNLRNSDMKRSDLAKIEKALDPANLTGGQEVAPPPAALLQNRNRATSAAIAQMRSIASRPDYNRLGFSRDFANGAPVVVGGEIAPEQMGRNDKAVMADGHTMPVRYAVIEAGDILTSNTVDGSTNPEYTNPNIDGTRAVAGNGRVAGLQAAYNDGTSADYKAALAGDDLHGISPEAIKGMKNPVLVRVMPESEVTANIGDLSNTSGTLQLSPVEQARTDSRRLDLTALDFTDDGEVTPEAVKRFVQAMPQAEQGQLIDTTGAPTRQAVDRLSNALFSSAYKSDGLVRLYAQATDIESRTVMNALAQAAPAMSRLEGAGAFDIRGLLTAAAEQAINARRRGIKIGDMASQTDVAMDPNAAAFLDLFAANPRGSKAVAEALIRAANFAYGEGMKEGTDLFGEVPRATRADVLAKLGASDESGGGQTVENTGRGATAAQDAGGETARTGGPSDLGGTQAARPTEGQGGGQALNEPQAAYNTGKQTPTEPFYSALSKHVESAPIRAAGAQGWTDYVKGLVNSGKVKAAEVEWSGLNDWLAMQKGKVTGAQVKDFLDNNGVKVTETVLGTNQLHAVRAKYSSMLEAAGMSRDDAKYTAGQIENFATDLGHDPKVVERGFALLAPDIKAGRITGNEMNDAAASPGGNTKFGAYKVPGGENYREVLLTLPQRGVIRYTEANVLPVSGQEHGFSPQNDDLFWYFKTPDNLLQIAKSKYPDQAAAREYVIREKQPEAPADQNFKSGHWDTPNILASIRATDRTDAQGNKTLFIEEIQSDWAQKGRAEGFSPPDRSAAADAALSKAGLHAEFNGVNWLIKDADGKMADNKLARGSIAFAADKGQAAAMALGQRNLMPTSSSGKHGPVPEAPFVGTTDAWVSLAMKRIVKMAVDEGYDRVAFANGEQNAGHYDLSKSVSLIDYKQTESGAYRLGVVDTSGDPIRLPKHEFTAEELPDVVGKEIAQKIISGEGEKGGGRTTLRNPDLKVGGEGMRAFYDKIVPKVAADVVKKVGGDGLTTVTIGTSNPSSIPFEPATAKIEKIGPRTYQVWADGKMRGNGNFNSRQEAEAFVATGGKGGASDQTGFDITPRMRDSAAGGMPLFENRATYDVPNQETKVYGVKEPEHNYDLPMDTFDLFGDTQPAQAPAPAPTPVPAPNKAAARKAAAAIPAAAAAPPPEASPPPANTLAVREDPHLPGLYHMTSQLVQVGERGLPMASVKTIADASHALSHLSHFAVEHMDILITDANGKPLAVVGSFKGAQTQASVYPATVLMEALRIDGAANAWGVHNHPSGTTTLSAADLSLSRMMSNTFASSSVKWQGLSAVGQRGDAKSFTGTDGTSGALPTNAKAVATVPIVERTITGAPAGPAIDSPERAKAVVSAMSGQNPGILFVNAQNQPTAWVPLNKGGITATMKAEFFDKLINAAAHAGASAAFFSNPSGAFTDGAVNGIKGMLAKGDVRLLDSIDTVNQTSAAERGAMEPGANYDATPSKAARMRRARFQAAAE